MFGVDLRDIDFTKTPLTMLKSCNLTSITLNRINLSGLNLSGFNLRGAYLSYSDLHNTNLRNANLEFAHLYGANLSNANLSGANLRHIYLNEETNFNNTDLSGADFTYADLVRVNFKGAKNLKEAKLKGAEGLKKGCYLTTACTQVMQLPDNCYELQTLRKFRDDHVAKTSDGRNMIEEYYETAPEIVDAINAAGNGNEIFRGLYTTINDIVSLIEKGKSEEAVLAYRNLTISLKNKYLI